MLLSHLTNNQNITIDKCCLYCLIMNTPNTHYIRPSVILSWSCGLVSSIYGWIFFIEMRKPNNLKSIKNTVQFYFINILYSKKISWTSYLFSIQNFEMEKMLRRRMSIFIWKSHTRENITHTLSQFFIFSLLWLTFACYLG